MSHCPATVLSRIDEALASALSSLDNDNDTGTGAATPSSLSLKSKSFANLSQCRSLTNIILVLSFVQKLLLSHRTTTNRELYYIFITHFRSQRECDAAIVDVCNVLAVDRISLGLTASPKGKLIPKFAILGILFLKHAST